MASGRKVVVMAAAASRPVRRALLVVVAVVVCTLQLAPGAESLRWCARKDQEGPTGVTELEQCNALVAMLNKAKLSLDPDAVPIPDDIELNTFTCVESETCESSALKVGEADLAVMLGFDQYRAGIDWAALLLLGQLTGETAGTIGYYSVAVIPKRFCGSDDQVPNANATTAPWSQLAGKRVCGPAFRNKAGWYFPAAQLIAQGHINATLAECARPSAGYRGDVDAIESFFGSGCVLGANHTGPLCANCAGSLATGEFCDDNLDPYRGQSSAFKCLLEGGGDVAFMKHSTPYFEMMTQWYISGAYDINEYMLMCKQGGCGELTDFERCNMGIMPSPAVVFNPANMDADTREFVRETVFAASQTAEFGDLFYVNTETLVEPNDGNLVFHSGMTGIDRVYRDMKAYLGESFNLFSTMTEMEACAPRMSAGEIVVPGNPLVPGSPTTPLVIVNKKKEGESPLVVALIVILCIAIVVVAALLYRNRDCGGKMEHFDRPGEPKDDLSPVMHGGFINSSFHNVSL